MKILENVSQEQPMKAGQIVYTPSMIIHYTRQDVKVLMRCSGCHYDGVCKEAGQPGPRGFLHGMNVRLGEDEEGEFELKFREIDTLAKIVEVPPPDVAERACELAIVFRQMLIALNKSVQGLNGVYTPT